MQEPIDEKNPFVQKYELAIAAPPTWLPQEVLISTV